MSLICDSYGRGIGADNPLAVIVTSVPNTNINGLYAHDTATASNPLPNGARAINTIPTAVSATGDITNLYATMQGALVMKPYAIPEAEMQFACTTPVVNTTDLALFPVGGAGIRNYITSIQLKNTSAVATEVVIKDGSTVIWRGHLGASMTLTDNIQFRVPIKGTANTVINFACITTGASVYVSAQGYKAS